MAFCSKCGTNVPDGTAFCPKCGTAQGSAAPAAAPTSGAQSGGLDSNIAGALAYLWLVAILWLVLEPYNKDRFIRFHAFQALAFGVGWMIISTVLSFILIIGWILLPFASLGILIVWLICIFKAFNKQMFKLPVIGDWAEQQAGKA